MRWQFFTPLLAILFMASVLGCEPPQPVDNPPVNPTPPAEQFDADGAAATEEDNLNNNAENDLDNDNLPTPSSAEDQVGG